jgi:chorismate mutase
MLVPRSSLQFIVNKSIRLTNALLNYYNSALEVGNVKREAHLPVMVLSREQQVIEKAQELGKGGPLPAEAVGRIYQKLVEEMRNWEAKLDATASQSASPPAATGGSK